MASSQFLTSHHNYRPQGSVFTLLCHSIHRRGSPSEGSTSRGSGGSRIFPRGGREPSRGGVNTPNFPENCMKSKEFGRPGGACVPHAPPRSANAGGLHPGESACREGLHLWDSASGGVCIHVSRGACIGGSASRRSLHPKGGQTPSSDTTGNGEQAGGTHPTGMHSC